MNEEPRRPRGHGANRDDHLQDLGATAADANIFSISMIRRAKQTAISRCVVDGSGF